MTKRRKGVPRVFDIAEVLRRRVTVVQGDSQVKMQPWEASTRALLVKALEGNMRAARRFLERCRGAGLFEIPEESDDHQYRLVIPREWDHEEWMAMFDQRGPPPWPGERNGMPRTSYDR